VGDAAAYLDVVLGTSYRRTLLAPQLCPVQAAWSATLGYAGTDPQTAAVAYATAARLADSEVISWSDAQSG
jgi:amidase